MEDILEYEFVTIKMKDKIAYIELHNEKQNKVKSANFLPLNEFRHWMEQKKPKGLIIHGLGRHFSSGADLDYLKIRGETEESFIQTLTEGKEILNYIEQLPIITVAAIRGSCCGAGLEIALCCQFRVASVNSVFSFPESSLGLLPGMGGTVRLPKLIGRKNALKMILAGERYFVEEALDLGIIDCITEKNEHIVQAEKYIKDLCNGKSILQINNIIASICSGSQQLESEYFTKLLKEKEIIL